MKHLTLTSVAVAALVGTASTSAGATAFQVDGISAYVFVHQPDIGLTVGIIGDGEQLETVGAAMLDSETGQITFRTTTLDSDGIPNPPTDFIRTVKAADGTALNLDAYALVTALVDIVAITKKHPFAEANVATDLLAIDPNTFVGILNEKLLVAADVPELPVPDVSEMRVTSPVQQTSLAEPVPA